MRTKIYFAAPLFTREERALNLKLTDILSNIFDVYLPQRDGVLLVDEVENGKPVTEVKSTIFHQDCNAIKYCEIVFAVLNGRTIDEGVSFELGYGCALGKLCWGYKEDWRTLFKYGDNPMIEGAVQKHFNSIEELVEFVNRQ